MTTTTARHHYRKPRQSIVIHGGVSRQVVVKACPNCGQDLKGVECPTIYTRFNCPECGISIENSNENRCRVCFSRCADSETYNAHKHGGCPYAKTLYPGSLLFRGENVGVRQP